MGNLEVATRSILKQTNDLLKTPVKDRTEVQEWALSALLKMAGELGVLEKALEHNLYPAHCIYDDTPNALIHRSAMKPFTTLCGYELDMHTRITPIRTIPNCPDCLKIMKEEANVEN